MATKKTKHSKPNPKMRGWRFNEGKLQWHLFPFDAARPAIKVLMYGSNKYAPRNWEHGMQYSTVFDCAMRHAIAWWYRDPADPESGLSHLAHWLCNVLFLMTYEIRGLHQYDDRPFPLKVRYAPVKEEKKKKKK